MKYLVLDTNVYLHYKDFEEIPWKSYFNDDVVICVPMKVLNEIDKHKDQDRGKVQKRAKKLSSRFSEVFLQGDTPKAPIEEMKNPPASAFNDEQFNKDVSDDWIILSALCSNHNNDDIVIVSSDNGILLKAKSNRLGFFKMPDDLLLKEDLSDEEKEIKKLKEQLFKYENRQPKPVIEFRDQTNVLTIIRPSYIDVKKELEIYKEQLKAKYPYQPIYNGLREDIDFLTGKIQNQIYSTVEQRKEYNKELDEFFKKKELLKEAQLYKQLFDQYFFEIELWLSNVGTSSLEDTAIFITFPEEVPIYGEKSKKKFELEDPFKPVLRTNLTDNLCKTVPGYYSLGSKSETKKIEIWDDEKKRNQQEVKYGLTRLLHNMRYPLNTSDKIFINIAKCGNFTINWTVIDSALIEPVHGELHVIIKDEEKAESQNIA